MKKIVQRAYGGTDQLSLVDSPTPSPKADEVLVAVRAAGVDRGTWHLMTGHPYAVRAVFGLRKPKYDTPGRDFAGVVAAAGSEVTDFVPGDEVFGTTNGSFSEYVVAKPDRLAHKPTSISFEQAAALAVSGVTALQAVRDNAHVQSGQRVLVIGASGGVGSYAVQIATALGAHVVGVASATKADFVRELGAVDVIDYTTEPVAARGGDYDAVIDTGGNRPLSELISVMAPAGTLVIVGAETSGRWLGGAGRQVVALVKSKFVSQTLIPLMSRERGSDFATLATMVDAGDVTPRVDRAYPLAQAGQAIDALASGAVHGKLALSI